METLGTGLYSYSSTYKAMLQNLLDRINHKRLSTRLKELCAWLSPSPLDPLYRHLHDGEAAVKATEPFPDEFHVTLQHDERCFARLVYFSQPDECFNEKEIYRLEFLVREIDLDIQDLDPSAAPVLLLGVLDELNYGSPRGALVPRLAAGGGSIILFWHLDLRPQEVSSKKALHTLLEDTADYLLLHVVPNLDRAVQNLLDIILGEDDEED